MQTGKKTSKKEPTLLISSHKSLRKNKTELASLATKEMGKPIKESLSEVEKCAWAMEFYADNSDIFLHDEAINTDARKSVISFEPLGVIASVMPWNFPYWQALRFAGSLAYGW
ncbi:aldehyde dehydrogenase family protein [Candidatus Nitrosotenuis chungbukensis]|uniref:aldehyde dehydrogenase family protein n=1 Tax=Candidatus Nitrosotenuis chungbukensis TaxID=1353246 RepID=UPI0026721147|nr:aldehyde dehydrogenase family protein [Candidatus Nitrosotenuis chungbukensis]WKT57360.1 aldehyde dehydrogenase family protein [Candidatus Nitrosotenuis chungbukensis]